MEYISLDSIPHFADCSPLVTGLGYVLVDLKVVPQNGSIKVTAVITKPAGDSGTIGVNDCARVHRALLPRLEAVLDSQDIYMEVASPGMERLIKNPAEFALFTGRYVRVWDSQITDWVAGKILSSDHQSITMELVGAVDAEQAELAQDEPVQVQAVQVQAVQVQTIPYQRISKAKLLQLGG
ncbi:MAG: ribosome maturation factor [Spirochaetaceae bacterium]|nr:ribosome maturation factor [Spirochaetaceae bacterium]